MSTVQLQVCETCEVAQSKYCCPACKKKSCSLVCVRRHKLEDDCSGVRDKTKYIALNAFSDTDLLSDYYFLEEVGRCVGSTQRSRQYFNKETSDSGKRAHAFRWLCKQANKQGTVVKLLPQGMEKHKANTSKTVKDEKTKHYVIQWRVHLMFTACETLYQVKSLSEETVLRALLDEYIHPSRSNPIPRHKLKSYVVGGGVDGIEVWLQCEGGVAYQCLDVDSTLKDNLKQKTFIEFPTLWVVPKGVGPPPKVSKGEELPKSSSNLNHTPCDTSYEGAPEGGVVPAMTSLQMISDMYSDSGDDMNN